jgi:hypothetical protein
LTDGRCPPETIAWTAARPNTTAAGELVDDDRAQRRRRRGRDQAHEPDRPDRQRSARRVREQAEDQQLGASAVVELLQARPSSRKSRLRKASGSARIAGFLFDQAGRAPGAPRISIPTLAAA